MSTIQSLRAYGYYVHNDQTSRQKALMNAIGSHGKVQVANRLQYIVSRSNCPTMKSDIDWLDKVDNVDSSSDIEQIKLSKFGYSTKKNESDRLAALYEAVKGHGISSVVSRLDYVIKNSSNKTNTFETDRSNIMSYKNTQSNDYPKEVAVGRMAAKSLSNGRILQMKEAVDRMCKMQELREKCLQQE